MSDEQRGLRPTYDLKNFWVNTDVDDAWQVDLRLALQEGRLVVSEVRLFPRAVADHPRYEISNNASGPHEPGVPWGHGEHWGLDAVVPAGGVSVRLLRRVPVHAHERLWQKRRRRAPRIRIEGSDGTVTEGLMEEMDVLLEQLDQESKNKEEHKTSKKGRPSTITDELLARVASIYTKAHKAGKRPTQAVARQLRNTSESRARDLVHRARLRGLLEKAHWGRAGGKLTKRAKEIIKNSTPSKKRTPKRKR